MKIILSRKGFDSANGGIVSPIFEDGSMVSFPIPSADKDSYADLQHNGVGYDRLLSELNYKGGSHCHVDPDLEQERRKEKIRGWIPAFGQIGTSALYLTNNEIESGDVFLFFGNFHFLEQNGEKYKYVKRSGDFYKDNDLQVIWGYLEVGEIIRDPHRQKDFWWHPHASEERRNTESNIIFVGSKELSFNKDKPGAGLLCYDEKRVLTLYGAKKATWKMNSVYDVDNIQGNRKNSAKDPMKGIYYSGIWQELVLKESNECEAWARQMLA